MEKLLQFCDVKVKIRKIDLNKDEVIYSILGDCFLRKGSYGEGLGGVKI